jgi:hypothetical protein
MKLGNYGILGISYDAMKGPNHRQVSKKSFFCFDLRHSMPCLVGKKSFDFPWVVKKRHPQMKN